MSRPNTPEAADFVSVVLADTLDVMYGPPEYGGNRDLSGWRMIGYAGDVQPRGWSDAEFIGVRVSLAVTGWSARGDETVVTATVGGDGFNGPSHFAFRVAPCGSKGFT